MKQIKGGNQQDLSSLKISMYYGPLSLDLYKMQFYLILEVKGWLWLSWLSGRLHFQIHGSSPIVGNFIYNQLYWRDKKLGKDTGNGAIFLTSIFYFFTKYVGAIKRLKKNLERPTKSSPDAIRCHDSILSNYIIYLGTNIQKIWSH